MFSDWLCSFAACSVGALLVSIVIIACYFSFWSLMEVLYIKAIKEKCKELFLKVGAAFRIHSIVFPGRNLQVFSWCCTLKPLLQVFANLQNTWDDVVVSRMITFCGTPLHSHWWEHNLMNVNLFFRYKGFVKGLPSYEVLPCLPYIN